MKSNKHIEIVCSTVPGLSSMSERSRLALFVILARHYTHVKITIINTVTDLEALIMRKPDAVVLGMKFILIEPIQGIQDTNKIWISSYLDEHHIAYTGSSQAAHMLEYDKSLAKRRILNAGLNTSAFYVARQNQLLVKSDILLRYPVFIKPLDRGGGIGVDEDSIAHTFDELRSKVYGLASELQTDALIEEYLPGREFSVALLRDDQSAQFSVMPIELAASSNSNGLSLLSKAVKSSNTEVVSALTDSMLKSQVIDLALDAFNALGARDYGRIDIRLDASGVPHFLEANLIPSLIKNYGSFPKACVLNKNMGQETMILHIVELALSRSQELSEDVSETVFDIIQPVFGAI